MRAVITAQAAGYYPAAVPLGPLPTPRPALASSASPTWPRCSSAPSRNGSHRAVIQTSKTPKELVRLTYRKISSAHSSRLVSLGREPPLRVGAPAQAHPAHATISSAGRGAGW